MIKPAQYFIDLLSEKLGPPFDSKDFLFFLENSDAIRRVKNPVPGTMIEYQDFEVIASSERLVELINEYIRQQDVELVITFPSKKLPAGWFRTREIIKRWFALTEKGREIFIIMPFLEPNQTSEFLPEIKLAKSKGASIRILTLSPDKVFKDGQRKQMASIDMLETAGFTVSHLVDTWFHSKIICFGEEAAYIGSANWTQGGFKKNLEMGVLLRGEKAKSIFRFFKSIMPHPSY